MRHSTVRMRVYEKDYPYLSLARCAVSLHSHTQFSMDTLSFLPEYASQVPILGRLFTQEVKRFQSQRGMSLDFSRFHWNPPASPEMVWDSEKAQIERMLEVSPLVSVTDHNDISAGLQLAKSRILDSPPISLEWSVPYENTSFHLGVHNLPPGSAVQWMKKMRNYRDNPNPSRLNMLLSSLSAHPQVLIVLNHPFWDQRNLGPSLHLEAVLRLLKANHGWIHALEFNGHRSHRENKAVLQLAKSCRLPVVAGGIGQTAFRFTWKTNSPVRCRITGKTAGRGGCNSP